MKRISKNGYGVFERNNSVYFSTGNHFYKFDFHQVTGIPRTAYLIQKYGKENKLWKRPFDAFVKLKNGDFITTFYQENEVLLHNAEGQVKKKFENIDAPFGMGIYGMALDANENLWIVVPVEHYIGVFDLNSEKELFSICGKDLEPTIFDHPESVTAIGDAVYISDMGNRRIVQIDIGSYEMTDYKKVKEPIYYFNQLNGVNIYQLQSGIYFEEKEAIHP